MADSPIRSDTPTSLAPGDRLGPYEIVELLGAGGMGEVYRAHDERLRRDVALKILRGSLPADSEDVARFAREARAAGSLNHPNIVAVFDVGSEGGVPYLVTELLEGETLHAALKRGQLPFRKAVEYGIQIAQALDAAHAKGIWHRDVKPANAFITTDGRVKLLDFGIAKLGERQPRAGSDDTTTETTRQGQIRGTAGYMSPEQVLGKPLDHRTDIFALGAVLYEMFTGTRPFERPSTILTMTAVLQEDPPDPLTLNDKLPPAAAGLLRRCLEKNKEERFQSARDLAFGLQQLRESTGISALAPARRWFVRRRLSLVALVAAVVVEGAALAWLLTRPPDPLPAFQQLTFRRGRIGGARFAVEATAVIYSETGAENSPEVWRIDLDAPDSPASRLHEYPRGAEVMSVRPGKLLVSMNRRFVLGDRFVGTLALGPLSGATARAVETGIEDADFDPPGQQMAVVRSKDEISGRSQLEYPVGNTLYTTSGSLRSVRVSPDGRRVAFVEDAGGRAVSGRIGIVDGDRRVTWLTEPWTSVRGLAWSPRGDEIWFAAGMLRSNRSLRAVTLDGQHRTILDAPGSLTLWDVASDGRVLLARDEERRAIVGVPPGEVVERDMSLFDDSGLADLSSDGRRLLFRDRFGIYVRPTDGSAPTPVGLKDGFADALSPDGTLVLATDRTSSQLSVVPTGPGDPRPLPAHEIIAYRGARWFPDGRRILFSGLEKGRDLRSYVQSVNGGPPRPITPEKTRALAISPDGAWVAATGDDRGITLWPVAGGPSRVVKGSQPDDRPVAWSDDGRFLWLFRRGEIPAHVYQLYLDTGERRRAKTLTPPDSAGVSSIIEFLITPSGDAYFYGYTRVLSQLYLVRGLK